MDALRLPLRAELRRRWRAMLGLALLLGVIGGVVLTAAAGAQRTDTAYPRLLRSANAAQLLLITSQYSPPAYFRLLSHLPQVASLSVASLYDALLPARHGPSSTTVEAFSSFNDSFGVTGDRVRVVSGRVFDPRDPRAVMIDPQLAAREHLHPGSTLRLYLVPSDAAGDPELSRARDLPFRVSAVVVFDTQIVPASKINAEPTVLLSPPFSRTGLALSASYGAQAAVRLRPGAAVAPLLHSARTLAQQYPATRQGVDLTNLASAVAATQRAIRPQAVALALFAGLTGLVALAVIGQLLSRQLSLDSADFPVLRALGMTQRGLLALSMARLAVMTVAAGVIAVAVAVAASPLMPIGAARLAEPDPGVDVNAVILGLGAALIIVLPLLVLLPAAWRTSARVSGPLGVAEPDPPARASRLGALARSGPVTGSVGVRMAFQPGHGRTAVPVRSALAGTPVAVASVVAAVVFGASLVHLVSTPRLYGQDWQQQLDLEFGAVPEPLLAHVLAHQPGLAGYAIGNYGQVTVDGRILPAIGVAPVRGQNFLTLLAGHAPARADEIAFGAQTLRDLHRRVGQQVQVLVNGRQRVMRITGTAVLASFSRGSFAATDLGSGTVLTPPVLSQPNKSSGCPAGNTCYSFALLRYRPGTDLRAAAARLTRITHQSGCPPGSCLVVSDQRPNDIRNYTGVRNTPLFLGIALALLAVGTLTHVLLTSVRRRRRDLAMLKTLGMVRWQVLGVVEWQAASFAAVALLIGVPLGILAGRWAWVLFAGAAGVSPAATVPVPLVLAAIPVTMGLALLIAAGPGRTAARVRPAAALRAG